MSEPEAVVKVDIDTTNLEKELKKIGKGIAALEEYLAAILGRKL